MTDYIKESLSVVSDNFRRLESRAQVISAIAEKLIAVLSGGNKVIFCGNGGSAADAQHLSAELMGRYKFDRPPMPAMSLTTDTSALTAIGNDYGFESVFARQLRGIGRRGDVLVGISTSGNSANVVAAFKQAGQMGISTVAFTGAGGGAMREIADIALAVPSSATNNIQEMHIACGHIICGIVEKHFFGGGNK